ncbi:ATPase [Rugamonas sp. FT82W]|uniref:ATPase n=1 Tax=Duganella vulcania TaxID=2692166 RepID=A0A845FYM9_9BURK|nr:BadF/BadG/BcrA/BcrD ATPase family protein [Duganella vulcania]MYM85907.1 ATPase [Duganella vulcania]
MGELGLGIDAGGTQTRWALADAAGAIVAEGAVAGLSATQMGNAAGRDAVRGIFSLLAAQVLAVGKPQAVCAGLTGFDGLATLPAQWLAELLQVAPPSVALRNDVEIAYLDSFAPGEGYLVYAGTGSIAAWIAVDGTFHRAGGRGVTLDDGGGGFWIAREAMRHIWRLEDEQPGIWQQSTMARAVFEQVGGSDWALSRQFIYGQDRGAIGRLALAVAASADADPVARAILEQAGRELARIGLALVGRYGPRPIVLSGRAATLHPLIAQAMRAALPPELPLRQKETQAHHAAARIALHSRN